MSETRIEEIDHVSKAHEINNELAKCFEELKEVCACLPEWIITEDEDTEIMNNVAECYENEDVILPPPEMVEFLEYKLKCVQEMLVLMKRKATH
jgi:hypothetical protein